MQIKIHTPTQFNPVILEDAALLRQWMLSPENDVKVLIAFSGGKDSIAMVLHALEMGVPKENIELWHHDVDGGAASLFDWPCTKSYCIAFAKAFGLKLLFSFAHKGIVGEIFRDNETIKPVFYQDEPDGIFHELAPVQRLEFMRTRKKFPAVSADINTRWCSWVAKIGVMNKAINNSARFNNANMIIMTGERRQESTTRSRYKEVEKYRSFTNTRKAVLWRSIIDWTDKEVWDIIARHKVQCHPCYELGWSRCSCQTCIFSSDNTWASIAEISPDKISAIAAIETEINHTLYHKKRITDKVNAGTSFIPASVKQRWLAEALGEFVSPIIVGAWQLPAGAFKHERSGAN